MEIEKMLHSSPHKDLKKTYIIINILIIIGSITFLIFESWINKLDISLGLCTGILLLFNGLWSINKKNYSFFHRDDTAITNRYYWFFLIAIGTFLLIITGIYILSKVIA
ncbi:MAG TPA: hypothetical protein PK924_04790 [Bacilli bacterium]|nr:hypothetical protein [Bacilli bacterium]